MSQSPGHGHTPLCPSPRRHPPPPSLASAAPNLASSLAILYHSRPSRLFRLRKWEVSFCVCLGHRKMSGCATVTQLASFLARSSSEVKLYHQ